MTRYPKDDNLYLNHMLENIDLMLSFVEDGKRDDKTFYAVIRCFEVIAEAAKHISDDFKKQYPELPWTEMRGMRNALVHDYLGIHAKSLWDTVSHDIPLLREQITSLLNVFND